MMEQGWFATQRSLFVKYAEGKQLSKYEAAQWLLGSAQIDNRQVQIGKDRWVVVKRGQLITSLDSLEKAWRRDRKTVVRWLQEYENDGLITRENTHPDGHPMPSLITLCNYDNYEGVQVRKVPPSSTHNNNITISNNISSLQSIEELREEEDTYEKKEQGVCQKKLGRLEKFDQWRKANREKIARLTRLLFPANYPKGDEPIMSDHVQWVNDEIYRMRQWVETEPKGEKKNWYSFMRRWLSRSLEKNPPRFPEKSRP